MADEELHAAYLRACDIQDTAACLLGWMRELLATAGDHRRGIKWAVLHSSCSGVGGEGRQDQSQEPQPRPPPSQDAAKT